jgi:putative FmdB family regulatory protein
MPIYEYERPDGTTFELMQSFAEEPLTHDPESGVPVRRVLHAPALHFKGKGFYNTDYGTRRRQRELAAQGDTSPSSDAAAKNGKAPADGGSSADAKTGAGKVGESAAKPAKSDARSGKASRRDPVSTK